MASISKTWSEDELALIRKPRSLGEYFPQNLLAGPPELVVNAACCGIVGGRPVMELMQTQTCYSHLSDLESEYKPFIAKAINLAEDSPLLHTFGNAAGDCLTFDLCKLLSCDVVMAGPPCPPWAGNGCKQGVSDARADVFERIAQWIIYFAIDLGCLKAFMLENVAGMLKAYFPHSSYSEAVLEALREALPDWFIDVVSLNLNTILPHDRHRIFFRGCRKMYCVEGLPPPLPAPARRLRLKDILTPELPNICRMDLPMGKRRNLLNYERQIRVIRSTQSDLFDDDTICCFSVDRALDKKWNSAIKIDTVPTLTTTNVFLFLVSVGDMHRDDKDRAFFRYLHPAERVALQGFPDVRSFTDTLSPHLVVKAMGNCYPPPLVYQAFGPVLSCISQAGSSGMTSSASRPSAATLRFSIRKKLRKVSMKAKSKAKAKAKSSR